MSSLCFLTSLLLSPCLPFLLFSPQLSSLPWPIGSDLSQSGLRHVSGTVGRKLAMLLNDQESVLQACQNNTAKTLERKIEALEHLMICWLNVMPCP